MKKARFKYNKETDGFEIQFNTGEGWLTDCTFHCVAREGGNGETNFIHWSILQKLTDMAYQGYTIDFTCGGGQ